MNTRISKTVALASVSIASLLLPFAANAQEAKAGWEFSVMPYVWLPSLNADLKYGPPASGGSSANVNVDQSALLKNLDGAMMIVGEARKGPWLLATDYVYLNLGKSDSQVKSVDFNTGPGPVNVSTTQVGGNTESSLKGSIWSLVGGYAVVKSPAASMDLLVGFRYLDLKATTNWNLNAAVTLPGNTLTFNRSGSVTKSQSITTPIIGAKGRVKLGQSEWFVPYYIDVGGDGSASTWQAAAGIGYDFKWGDVRLDYRHMAYSQGDDKLINKLELGGFALGANFRF